MGTLTAISHATIVANMYKAFQKGDIPYLISQVTDDCEWHVMGDPVLPHGGTYKGKNDIGLFFETMNDHFEFTEFTPNSINEINDEEVVALGHMTVRSRATGKSDGTNWTMHIRFRDDKVFYFHDYYDSVKFAETMKQPGSDSNKNVARVNHIYESFGRGDIPAILDELADDVQWEQWADNTAQKAGVPWLQARKGKYEVSEFFKIIGTFNIKDFRVLSVMGNGNQVAAEFIIEADVPSTGGYYRDEEMHLWTFNDEGKVTRLRHYADTAKHTAAAGINN
ncbi:MAG: nuclear transport factor 2 family protein [Chitinophagaceae bacterium]|nr:nuclear transport factor 2 family protein [Chitinophagaceae bacterium]